jgi:hypothetical protein
MAAAGWQEIETQPGKHDLSALYYHESGSVALVKFAECDDAGETKTCIDVWVSLDATERPAAQNQVTVDNITPSATFAKKTPADDADGIKLPKVSLSWNAYTGGSVNRYRYCVDDKDDNDCTASGGWTNAWSSLKVDVVSLAPGKTYYWQIQAVLKDNTKVSADDGKYWNFSTVTFEKVSPAVNAQIQPPKVTLSWKASPFTNPAYYKYCISIASVACDNWVSTTNTSVVVPVKPVTSYKWQVMAYATSGESASANGGAWWKFATTASKPRFDFDGNLKDDIALFRSSNKTWYFYQKTPKAFGTTGDIPVPADYNGDGKAEIAVFRPSSGTWLIFGQTGIVFGKNGDIPVPADYNGDGKVDIAVFRPSTGGWWIRNITSFVQGQPGDIPVPADYNGDGKTESAIFRPSTGAWTIRNLGTLVFGQAGDILVPGDYNADGKAERAYFRPSEGKWYIQGQPTPISFGSDGDIPVPSDFNGDGAADVAYFRPSTGEWAILARGIVATFGTVGDKPIGAYYYTAP